MLIRLIDIIASSIAILIGLPILMVIALALRFTGEREVFFLQSRIGKAGKPFNVFKFATMLKDSPNIGTGVLTVKDDPRILPLGRFLRRSKLNEVPQLLNVVLGDMSLIGPRPQAPSHFSVFPEDVKRDIRKVRPGLSGIGSIVFRDEESILECAPDKEAFYADVIAPYKGKVEQWYINRRSVPLYLLLIGLTIWSVAIPGSRAYKVLFRSLPVIPPELDTLWYAPREIRKFGNKKRVILVSDTSSDGQSPGIFRHFELGDLLAKDGWRVYLFTATSSNKWDAQLPPGAKKRGSIVFVRLRTPFARSVGLRRGLNMIVFATLSARLLTRVAPHSARKSVIVTSSTGSLDNFAAVLSQRFSANKWIAEVRDIWPDSPRQLHPTVRTYGLFALSNWAARIAARRADGLISPLHSADQALLRFTDSRQSIPFLWLPNCQPRRKNLKTSQDGLDRLSSTGMLTQLNAMREQNQSIVGYFGSMNSGNDVIRLATLATAYNGNDIAFVFVGDGGQSDQIRAAFKSNPNAHIFAAVHPLDVMSLMSLVDVLLLGGTPIPAHSFGVSPLKYPEYLSVGKPIFSWGVKLGKIETNSGHMVEVDANAPVADALSGLTSLLQEPEGARNRRGEISRAIAKERYQYTSYQRTLSQFLSKSLEITKATDTSLSVGQSEPNDT